MIPEERFSTGFETEARLRKRRLLASLPPEPAQGSSLEVLLASAGPFPPSSVTLGMCQDGLPFLLDLTDEETGSLLLAGDPGCGKTRLLRSILASAVYLNPAGRVSFSLVAGESSAFSGVGQAESCLDLLLPGEDAATGLVLDLADLMDQRLEYGWIGPVVLLAVDGLLPFLEGLHEAAFERFYSLLLDGPSAGVRVIATVNAGEIEAMDDALLQAFNTRLVGRLSAPQASPGLAGAWDYAFDALEAGLQFCALSGQEVIPFWILDSDL